MNIENLTRAGHAADIDPDLIMQCLLIEELKLERFDRNGDATAEGRSLAHMLRTGALQ